MYDMRQVIVNYNLLAGTIKKELDEQFDSGRIKGTEYADVFNKLMQQAMQHAFSSPVQEQQLLQIEEQVKLTEAQAKDQNYVIEHIRPQEKLLKACEVDLCHSNVKMTDARTADQEYVTQNIRPTESLIKLEELDIAESKAKIAEKDIDIRQKELEIKNVELDIAIQKLELAKADASLKEAQVRLTDRQILGFDDNKAQKLFDAQMNSWAMMFSSGLLDKVPSIISGDKASQLYCKLAAEVGVPC